MTHNFFTIKVGKVYIGVVHVTVRCNSVTAISEAFLIQLTFNAMCMHREVPFNIEARVGALRSSSTLRVGGIGWLNDIEEHGLQVSLVLPLLIEHSLLLWIDLQLNAIYLPFSILSVNLVVHTEE